MLAWRPIGQVISKVWYIKICKPLFAWKPANLKAGQMFSWPMGGLFHLARGAPASPRRLNPRSILLHLPVLTTTVSQWRNNENTFLVENIGFTLIETHGVIHLQLGLDLLTDILKSFYQNLLSKKRAFTKMWVLGGMCYWVTQRSIEIRKYLRFFCSVA